MKLSSRTAVLFFLLLTLAPACAPPDAPPATPPPKLVVLTEAARWDTARLGELRRQYGAEGYRVIVSGYAGETPAGLLARLPWLLQPGVDRFVYDPRLAGAAGRDSLVAYLGRIGHPATVELLGD